MRSLFVAPRPACARASIGDDEAKRLAHQEAGHEGRSVEDAFDLTLRRRLLGAHRCARRHRPTLLVSLAPEFLEIGDRLLEDVAKHVDGDVLAEIVGAQLVECAAQLVGDLQPLQLRTSRNSPPL